MHLFGLANIFGHKPTLSGAAVLITVITVIAGWWIYRRPELRDVVPLRMPFRFAAATLGLTYLLFLVDLITSYPTGYDTISYHLLVSTQWLQSGTMRLTDGWWKKALPDNGELFSLPVLSLRPLPPISLGNMIALAVLALSIYAVSKYLSRSHEGAVLSVVVLLSAPIVIFQTFSFNVDLFGTAFVYAALAFFFTFLETKSTRAAVLCALCAGVSMGTKQVFMAYAGLILVALMFVVIKARRQSLLLLLMAAALAPSTLWIVRNWEGTGNPFYPFAVRLGGIALKGAPAFPPFVVKASVTGPIGEAGRNNPISEDRGLGPAFVTFAVASILAALVECVRNRRARMITLTAAFLSLSILWWVEMHVIRFALPLFAMMAVFSSILFGYFTASNQRIARALLAVGVVVSCLMSLATPVNRAVHRWQSGDFSRATFYGYPALIDKLPVGTAILDRSRDTRMGFELMGQRGTNRVLHIDGPLTPAAVTQSPFGYVLKDGEADQDDRILTQYADLVYEGYPSFIFPDLKNSCRIYKMKKYVAVVPWH